VAQPSVYVATRRVEFRDTDAAGIVHFSRFFTLMEESEHELLRHLGMSVMQPDGDGKVTWPRVSANCDFRGSARFEEELQIEVRIERIGEKSVTYAFRFLNGGQMIAEGNLVAVCCRMLPGKPLTSIPIPAEIRTKLETYQQQCG
jgi:acyl-CoA thioester hydrolase